MGVPELAILTGLLAMVAGTLAAGVGSSTRPGLCALAVGLALLGVAGAWLFASGQSLGAGFTNSVRPAFGLDPLSGFFLLLIAAVGVPAALFAGDALEAAQARSLAVTTGAFLLVLVAFVSARDVSTFLAFWELMTLVPAAAILIARQDPGCPPTPQEICDALARLMRGLPDRPRLT